MNSGSGAYLTLLPSPLPSPMFLTELRLQFQAQQFPALQMASLQQEAWIPLGGSPSLSQRAEGHLLPSCPLHAYHAWLHLVAKNWTVQEILRGFIRQKGSEGKKGTVVGTFKGFRSCWQILFFRGGIGRWHFNNDFMEDWMNTSWLPGKSTCNLNIFVTAL